jgi:NADH-quinone oxidoreductase subunit E
MYLISQIWWYLALAFLLGALIGYLLWRLCNLPLLESRFERSRKDMAARLAMFENQNAGDAAVVSSSPANAAQNVGSAADAAENNGEAVKAARAAALAEASERHAVELEQLRRDHEAALARWKSDLARQHAANSAGETPLVATAAGERPADILSAPRGGKADDLKLIWGVGPKLEKLLNRAGFYHFEQIAKWSEKELAWVDSQLGEFAGRATRDKWIEQCQKLATGWRPQNEAGDKPA